MSEERQEQPETNAQPNTKAETIQVLQQTIQRLETIIAKLEAQSVEDLPSTVVFAKLIATTDELAASLEKRETHPSTEKEEGSPTIDISDENVMFSPTLEITEVETSEEKVVFSPTEEITDQESPNSLPNQVPVEEATVFGATEAEVSKPTTTTAESEETEKTGWLDRLLPSFSSIQRWWDGVLTSIRAVLPRNIEEKLSDWALTGILTGVVVVILWTTVALLPEPAAKRVAEVPPEISPLTPAPEEVSPPTAEVPPEISPLPPTAEVPPEISPLPPTAATNPVELEAPGEPESVETLPPPEPIFTPEQSLIAAIQQRVATLTEEYANGLIQSIQADFPNSRLLVRVTDDWYGLDTQGQEKLANEMLARSQKLDFRKLYITDSQGEIVARNAVIGDNMLILKGS
ncbi:hypothetical protein [Oscillatoria salina]|uniref:hypothetical protein n=1 Tax=Oscillatoria salina TaxID=331517 RepID=UPI0013BD32BA|nr:hypothetical protein [Oscillatoria salina]MBZ8182059.1 hypothetical protein [Oscillatoria salina IIICB1]NET87284.1 hypothetical protein [Kamptonema sp. SIO1D9]